MSNNYGMNYSADIHQNISIFGIYRAASDLTDKLVKSYMRTLVSSVFKS